MSQVRYRGWFKSSYSAAASDNCVEVRLSADHVGVRDSKDRSGPPLVVPVAAWNSFLTAAKSGYLDDPV
ncbi:MAG: DUF397 domain-containing protein [Saccharopolyspora sp.]|uniref:DUF397 domain-containing protein n=1 Tax=unclassified Saccharopolyspora TaxID=2646250 RepID=UPI0025FD8182|nr:DUF397 domain-containing protein [Saccharopolyspora sp.]MBQ6639567.1 DUF397 domain-containing protein [Saccharopolyspora sp.]